MRPTTHRAMSHERLVSSGTLDVQRATLPANTSAVELSVETTNARVTLDGTDPSAGNAPSIVLPFGQMPMFRPLGPGTIIRFVSTAGTPAVLQVVYYT